MDFEALKAFATVVKLGSFTKAAQTLGSQKATLSRTISRLEASLQVRLLQRSTRSLRLTEEGQEFYERTTIILQSVEDMQAAMERTRGTPSGVLRLTCGQEFGELVVSRWIGRYATMYPDVLIRAELTNRLVDVIHEGFDVAIRVGHLPDSDLSVRKLGDVSYGFYASPAYIERKRAPASLADISSHDVVGFSATKTVTWQLHGPEGSVDHQPAARVIVNNNLAALNLAANGVGIAVLPDFQARKLTEAGKLVRVLPDYVRRPVPVSAIFSSGRFLSPKVRAFIDVAQDSFDGDLMD